MGRTPTVARVAMGALGILIGCGGASGNTDAGATGDGGLGDAAPLVDALPSLLWVDFSVTGCTTKTIADGGLLECEGATPLSLSFAAVAPAEVTVHAWTFGDEGRSDEPSPTHLYSMPGTYDVSLSVLGPGGNASVRKAALVHVTRAQQGAACTGDIQCAVECVCPAGNTCPAGLNGGFCSEPCGPGTPCASGVCAALAPAPVASPDDWQRSLCLPDCSTLPCPEGLSCRNLRDGAGTGWVRACFVSGVLADIGASCADEVGALQASVCASGVCLDEGAHGVCSAPCATQACPLGSTCATFNGGDPAPSCLAACGVGAFCETDPWLACEAPGGAAAKNFVVTDAVPDPDGYCAPKACSQAADCAGGSCTLGFCAP